MQVFILFLNDGFVIQLIAEGEIHWIYVTENKISDDLSM